jgi:hypothetical protein
MGNNVGQAGVGVQESQEFRSCRMKRSFGGNNGECPKMLKEIVTGVLPRS